MLKQNLPKELQSIKKFASWNGYHKNIVNTVRKHVLSKETLTNDVIGNEEKDKVPTVFNNINYPGEIWTFTEDVSQEIETLH